jgi:integrase
MPETGTRTSKSPPSRHRLNDRFVKTVVPEARRRLYWDTIQPGLVLCVEQTGHKSYKLIYTFKGRARWYTIGNASKVGLKEARDIARKRMGEVYSGLDVQAERQAVRQASTFEQLAGRYVEEHAKRRNKSWRQADFLVCTYLLPRWRIIQASAITRGDARSIFDRLTQEGSPVLANQVLAAASAIFSWAMKNDVGNIAVNPCGGIERNSTSSRERVLSDRELPLFWRAFEEAGLMRCNALRMILLTGQRPGEVRHMRWEHVEDGWWTMPGEPAGGWPGTKNKQTHRVWLSQPAQDILAEVSNGGGPGFVFLAGRGGPVPALDAAMRSICHDLRVNEKVTPHDLRRTHGTTVTSLGFTRDQMNRLQNHKDGGIGSVYDRHSYADENRQIQEAVAARIMELSQA